MYYSCSQFTRVVHSFARFWNKKKRLFLLATQLSACREEPMVGWNMGFNTEGFGRGSEWLNVEAHSALIHSCSWKEKKLGLHIGSFTICRGFKHAWSASILKILKTVMFRGHAVKSCLHAWSFSQLIMSETYENHEVLTVMSWSHLALSYYIYNHVPWFFVLQINSSLDFPAKKRREFILTDPISLCFVGSWADFSKIRLCIAATCMGRSTGQGWKPLQHTMFDEGSIRFTTWWCTCSRHVWCGRACGGRSKMHACNRVQDSWRNMESMLLCMPDPIWWWSQECSTSYFVAVHVLIRYLIWEMTSYALNEMVNRETMRSISRSLFSSSQIWRNEFISFTSILTIKEWDNDGWSHSIS
jgi:hypothetical protein